MPCKIKVMYLPKYEDLVKSILETFKGKFEKVYTILVPLWDMNNEMKIINYTPEQLEFIHASQ